jgi:hypothetical protein
MALVHDIDRDGDPDVIGTRGQGSAPDARFVWAQNDGHGRFTMHENIAPGEGDFLQGVAVGRFLGEDRTEIMLSWHAADKGIQQLTIPDAPADEIWRWQRISGISQDEALSSGDIDRDGDLDLLLGTVWLRNDHTAWKAVSLNPATGPPDRNCLADIDGDGRLDAVVGYEIDKLAWYRQGESPTAEWQEHLIAADIVRPMSIGVADLDGDQDLDVVAGEHNLDQPKRAKLLVFENTDGRGQCWQRHLVYEGDEHHDGAHLADMDGDGDIDIVSIGWSHARVVLYENKSEQD